MKSKIDSALKPEPPKQRTFKKARRLSRYIPDAFTLIKTVEETFMENLEKIKKVLKGHAEVVDHDLKYNFIDILDPWSGTWNTIDIPQGIIYDTVFYNLGF